MTGAPLLSCHSLRKLSASNEWLSARPQNSTHL